MAESQILGLFASPQMVEDAVRQEIRQQAPQFESAPNQRLFTNIAQAGAAFDPRVQRARLQNKVAQELTTSEEFGSPEYYRQLADQYRQAGMLQSAVVAADKADSVLKQRLDKVKAKFGSISPKDYGSAVPQIGRLYDAYALAKTDGERSVIEKQIRSAMQRGSDEVAKQLGMQQMGVERAKLQAAEEAQVNKDLTKLYSDANSQAVELLGLYENVVSKIDEGTINFGVGASIKTRAQNLAIALGLASAEVKEIVANTEAAGALIGNMMLARIKQLGTNPSNADRDFLLQTLPSITNSEDAVRAMIEYMKLKADAAVADAQAKEKFANKHKEENGYKSLVGYVDTEAFKKLDDFFKKYEIKSSREALPDYEAMKPLQVSTEPPNNGDASTVESLQAQLDDPDITDDDRAVLRMRIQDAQQEITPSEETRRTEIPPPSDAVSNYLARRLSSRDAIQNNKDERTIYEELSTAIASNPQLIQNPRYKVLLDTFEYLDQIYGDQ